MNKIEDQRPESGNLIDGLGPLAFASRLKRLQDRLLRDAKRIYRELDSGFQPRWFLPFYALSSRSQVSITQLAASLSLSHAAVNHIAKELMDAGFVAESRDTHDDRKRLLSLTDKGYAMADKLSPVWSAFRSATQELFEEIMESWPRDTGIIAHCHTGVRSLELARHLRLEGKFTDVKSMSGGIDVWSVTVDSSVPRY